MKVQDLMNALKDQKPDKEVVMIDEHKLVVYYITEAGAYLEKEIIDLKNKET